MSSTAIPGQAKTITTADFLRKYQEYIVLAVIIAFLYARTLISLVQDWWDNPDYSHGLLLPFALGYLVYQKWDTIRELPLQPSWLGMALIVASQAIHLVGFLGAEFFLQRFSFMMLLAGLVLFLWGWKHTWESLFALFLLMLAIPLPTLIFNTVALPLQLLASAIAENSLHLLRIPVFREGNILMLSNQTLSVAEACSGIRSLMSLITLGVMVAYFLPFRWWLRTLFVATTVPIALIANAFRVSGTGVLAHYFGEEAAQGFFHTFSGWLVFVFAFAFLMLEVGFLMRLFGPKDAAKKSGEEGSR